MGSVSSDSVFTVFAHVLAADDLCVPAACAGHFPADDWRSNVSVELVRTEGQVVGMWLRDTACVLVERTVPGYGDQFFVGLKYLAHPPVDVSERTSGCGSAVCEWVWSARAAELAELSDVPDAMLFGMTEPVEVVTGGSVWRVPILVHAADTAADAPSKAAR